MSFQEEKRESIKRYLFEKIRDDDSEYIKKTMENFEISITTVKRYVADGLEQNLIEINSSKTCGYQLVTSETSFIYDVNEFMSEDKIYFEEIRPLLGKLSRNASKIWSYSFTEMMNNAIEHSNASQNICHVKHDCIYSEISIADNGIGIFKKVRCFLEQEENMKANNYDVLAELYKGKFTTNAESHSGEGIFFTSKVLNEFAIWSEESIFSSGVLQKQELVQSHLFYYFTKLKKIGTMVVMKLENETVRNIREVFDLFAPIEEGFVKTVIPLKEVCPYGEPVARSQARRIVHRLEEFKYVEFDCTDIDFMGQGFADEIFRVFQKKHPDLEIKAIHANETVGGMIQRVQRGGVK